MTKRTCEVRTLGEGETIRLGEAIGECLGPGDVVGLIGDLGAGKTCMAKGLARSLGVSDCYEITSPTFTIINEYPGRMTLRHVDAYRLETSRELIDAGFEDFFDDGGVVVVEWAEKIRDILPGDTLFVNFEYFDESTRIIRISGDESVIGQILEKYRRERE
ncbi:MAG: tRNA (adenosine(37)-N6)-threonylcarbamoyltransferase complex ATPase subunit type 1 TsaE [Syntrophales bacterium]|jgi:tRNA threonylcarbamoyladenosine biosynthesis protein TsaE|nr:tRNA (adenosine(37)-N6)-threonylcarbamoyltransferase complex ATPase subunit type 1 TsaE [Syntrophales bacterium]